MDFSDGVSSSDGEAAPSLDSVFSDDRASGGSDGQGEPSPYAGSICHNCGAELVGEFCHVCGQKAQELDIRFWQLFSEWLGGVIGFDARIWRTLRTLFLRPGQLTVDFLEGRRARYVSPLRLYLVASLAMALSLSWTGGSVITYGDEDLELEKRGPFLVSTKASPEADEPAPDPVEDQAEQASTESSGPTDGDPSEGSSDDAPNEAVDGLPVEEEPGTVPAPVGEPARDSPEHEDSEGDGEDTDGAGGIFSAIGESLDSVGEGTEKDRKAFDKSFTEKLPQVLFILVPVFAVQLFILFRRRYKRYLFHLIFSFHCHAATFFAIALVTPVDAWILRSGILGDLIGIVVLVYLFMAMRRVYGDSRRRVALKFFVLLSVHGMMIAFALVAALVLAAWKLQGG